MEVYIGGCFFSVRYLSDGGIDRSDILHDGTYRFRADLLPFWGQYPKESSNPTFWA